MFKKAWKKIVAVLGAITAIWLISPLPEVSIIVGIFGGKTLEQVIPPWLAWVSIIVGVIVGWVIVRRFKLLGRVKEKI